MSLSELHIAPLIKCFFYPIFSFDLHTPYISLEKNHLIHPQIISLYSSFLHVVTAEQYDPI